MTSGSSPTDPTELPPGHDASTDVAERLRFESLVIDLAAGFVNLEPEQVDQAIEDCLRRIVEALGLERSTLLQRSGDDLLVTHSWAVSGEDPFPEGWGRSNLPWGYEEVMAGRSIVFSSLDDLPPEAAIDKSVFARFG